MLNSNQESLPISKLMLDLEILFLKNFNSKRIETSQESQVPFLWSQKY